MKFKDQDNGNMITQDGVTYIQLETIWDGQSAAIGIVEKIDSEGVHVSEVLWGLWVNGKIHMWDVPQDKPEVA